MYDVLTMGTAGLVAQSALVSVWNSLWPYALIFIGFSAVIFVHELGHFLAASPEVRRGTPSTVCRWAAT